MRSPDAMDICPTIGSVEEGVLALWSLVLKQAVIDVGFGLRHGMITLQWVATGKRLKEDDSQCREALRFLLGSDSEIVVENLAAVTGVKISRDYLLRLARAHGTKVCDAWVNRTRLTDEERAQRREQMRLYQKQYHRSYGSKKKEDAA